MLSLNEFLQVPTCEFGVADIAFIGRRHEDKALSRSLRHGWLTPALVERTITTETQRAQRWHREKRSSREIMNPSINRLTHQIIGAAIDVHRQIGPGLLESAYRKCLRRELFLKGLPFEYEKPLPLEYKGIQLECGYRVDIVVGGKVAVEVKSIQALAPIHDAQLLTYLRLGGWPVGLLINFNVVVLKDGIHRRIMGYEN